MQVLTMVAHAGPDVGPRWAFAPAGAGRRAGKPDRFGAAAAPRPAARVVPCSGENNHIRVNAISPGAIRTCETIYVDGGMMLYPEFRSGG